MAGIDLTHTLDGCDANIEGFTEGLIGPPGLTLGLVGFEQNARMGQDFG